MRSAPRIKDHVLTYFFVGDEFTSTCAINHKKNKARHNPAWLSILFILLLSALPAAWAQLQPQPLEDLGTLPGGSYSSAFSVSGDGSVIVGYGSTAAGEVHAFRYDLAGGLTDLGTLSGGIISFATGVSADGAVIVGYALTQLGLPHAFRYANGVMTAIDGQQNSTDNYSYAYAVSGDGQVIVGERASVNNNISRAFRYDLIGGMIDLDPSGNLQSTAYGVSADGSVIVGSRDIGQGQFRAFRYDVVNGMTNLDSSGNYTSVAYGVSADGTVIVGQGASSSGEWHAFRYTNDGMRDLGTLGGNASLALGVSGNGRVIVGSSSLAGDTVFHAFKVVGNGLMTDLGTLGGINSTATGVSADGSVIVGYSNTANGVQHAFIYRNSMVDVPNTYTALGINAGQLAGLLNARHAALGFALHDECNSHGVRHVCVSAGGRSSRTDGGFIDTGTQLQLAYRLSPQLRIGASFDQGMSNRLPVNYALNNAQPLVALYLAYMPTGTSTGTPSGLQLKLSMAQASDAVGITRSALANTEAGHGTSSLTAKGMQFEAGWRWTLSRWQLMSFAGIKDTRFSRAAYTESSGADFPVSYQAVRQSSTTAYAGLQASSALTATLMVNFRGGVEQDVRRHQDSYAGTMEFLGPFVLASPSVQRTRAFLSINGAYQMTPTRQISLGVHYSQQPLQDAHGLTIMLRYSAAL